MSGHKEGEWHVLTDGRRVRVASGPGSFEVCTVKDYDGQSAIGTAARIVADHNAAPDLVAFVRNLRDFAEDGADAEVLAEVRGDFCAKLLAAADGE